MPSASIRGATSSSSPREKDANASRMSRFRPQANVGERKRLRILLLHDPGPALARTITLEFPLHAKGFDGFLDVGFADAETRGAFPHRGGALLKKKEEHLVLDFAPRRPFCGEIALDLDRLGDERERNRDDDRAGRKIEGFLAIAFDDEGDAMALCSASEESAKISNRERLTGRLFPA